MANRFSRKEEEIAARLHEQMRDGQERDKVIKKKAGNARIWRINHD